MASPPAETPLYALLESLYETVKGAWEDLFERRYGFWRGLLDGVVVAGYLDCGIFARGFARILCPDCAAEYLLAFITERRVIRRILDHLGIGSPRYPGSRSASGSRPGSRFPLIPLAEGADAPMCEAGPRPPRPQPDPRKPASCSREIAQTLRRASVMPRPGGGGAAAAPPPPRAFWTV